LSLFISDDLKP